MGKMFSHLFLRPSWKAPYIRFFSSRRAVILVYHGVPQDREGSSINGEVFEQHIIFLKQHFEIVAPDSLWNRREAVQAIKVILTFDDGFRNHAEVVAPILRKLAVPAIFFVCSRQSARGNYLWFNYLLALQRYFPGDEIHFRGGFFNMRSNKRAISIRRLWDLLLDLKPHPSAMYEAIEQELPSLEDFVGQKKLADAYAGITPQQVSELAADPLFSFGVHTVDHPFLTKCDPAEVYRQILNNKAWIEAITGKACNSIAYPSGVYNRQVLKECHSLGMTHGYALTPTVEAETRYELPRIGIYAPSLDVLGFKVQWGNHMRTLRLKVG